MRGEVCEDSVQLRLAATTAPVVNARSTDNTVLGEHILAVNDHETRAIVSDFETKWMINRVGK